MLLIIQPAGWILVFICRRKCRAPLNNTLSPRSRRQNKAFSVWDGCFLMQEKKENGQVRHWQWFYLLSLHAPQSVLSEEVKKRVAFSLHGWRHRRTGWFASHLRHLWHIGGSFCSVSACPLSLFWQFHFLLSWQIFLWWCISIHHVWSARRSGRPVGCWPSYIKLQTSFSAWLSQRLPPLRGETIWETHYQHQSLNPVNVRNIDVSGTKRERHVPPTPLWWHVCCGHMTCDLSLVLPSVRNGFTYINVDLDIHKCNKMYLCEGQGYKLSWHTLDQ